MFPNSRKIYWEQMQIYTNINQTRKWFSLMKAKRTQIRIHFSSLHSRVFSCILKTPWRNKWKAYKIETWQDARSFNILDLTGVNFLWLYTGSPAITLQKTASSSYLSSPKSYPLPSYPIKIRVINEFRDLLFIIKSIPQQKGVLNLIGWGGVLGLCSNFIYLSQYPTQFCLIFQFYSQFLFIAMVLLS